VRIDEELMEIWPNEVCDSSVLERHSNLHVTETEEEHEQAVWRVLEVLAEHKLFLCLEKCEFHRKWIEYLRLVISENKVEMDPVKVAGVCDWPIPENRTDVQAFIGFVNFYRHFIQDFSTIARPLFDLTRSDKA